jgi:hypothetical protein
LRRFPEERKKKSPAKDSLIEVPNPLSQRTNGSSYRIEMSDGTALEVAKGFSGPEVQELLSILRRRP